MTVPSAAGRPDSSGPWQWPVDATRYDTAPLLRAAEQDAVIELGAGNLRRLARHDPPPGDGSRSGACCGRSMTRPRRWRAR